MLKTFSISYRTDKTHKENISDLDKNDGRYHWTARYKLVRWRQGGMWDTLQPSCYAVAKVIVRNPIAPNSCTQKKTHSKSTISIKLIINFISWSLNWELGFGPGRGSRHGKEAGLSARAGEWRRTEAGKGRRSRGTKGRPGCGDEGAR